MKTLTLLRHAKSGWDDAVERDFDRPLNARGRKAAQVIGREMRAQDMRFDLVVASPALRVVETLAEISKGYGSGIEAEYDQRIYLASTATLLEVIHGIGRATSSLLVVGHNPGLEALALMLSGERGDVGLRRELAVKYPTATLANITLPVDDWAEVGDGTGRLDRFIRPRDLDPSLGPDDDNY